MAESKEVKLIENKGEESTEEEKTPDFSGMGADEISEYIDKNGIRIKDLDGITKALEKDLERQEEEYQESILTDWMKFKCHPVELELSVPISDANNYNAEFYRRSKCESDARELFRSLHREAKEALDKDNLYDTAYEEITDYAEEWFEEELSESDQKLSDEEIKELRNILDIDEFRREIRDELKKINVQGMRPFSDYYRLVEFEDSDGGCYGGDFEEFIGGVFNKLRKSWNYNGFNAYMKIEKDFRDSAYKYADKATKIARRALKKRIKEKENLAKTKGKGILSVEVSHGSI